MPLAAFQTEWLTVHQAAARLSVTPGRIYHLIHRGQLPVREEYGPGRARYAIAARDLAPLLEARRLRAAASVLQQQSRRRSRTLVQT